MVCVTLSCWGFELARNTHMHTKHHEIGYRIAERCVQWIPLRWMECDFPSVWETVFVRAWPMAMWSFATLMSSFVHRIRIHSNNYYGYLENHTKVEQKTYLHRNNPNLEDFLFVILSIEDAVCIQFTISLANWRFLIKLNFFV